MFIQWRRIKKVMAELYDPRDLTIHCGMQGLLSAYDRLCADRDIYEAFEMLCIVDGEQEFQNAAAVWRARILAKFPCLEWQIDEVLKGVRHEIN